MLGALGVGGPSVDTVLVSPECRPGGVLAGEVRVLGGDLDVDITEVTLGLVARVEYEHGEGEGSGQVEFHRVRVSEGFRLAAAERLEIPFRLAVPWETPITEVYGQPLRGMAMGVRTELAVAKAVDKGDLDEFVVSPISGQLRVLDALAHLGFRFKSADLEHGRIHGSVQELPFYQEIEFQAPPAYAGQADEIELTFMTDHAGFEVILEADKRSGRGDTLARLHSTHEAAEDTDWIGAIGSWLESLGSRHHGGHGHHGDHGHGAGGAAVGVAAGFAGGMIAAEIVDEVGDFFEGDEE
ncbi:sporulation protein [Rhizohabitans arisaemae]|uniref:sporulation protein n=1 Tax=Rhizohabitans arisaemae TaxID=2720610 RepID=UPI0024B241E0|nr:sporulation protein [Rhizohabitans arisaemae]